MDKIHETIKAGTILVDPKNKKIGIIYRKNHNDYEFPKGHLEPNETLQECAIRETAEETKRDAVIIDSITPYSISYTTKNLENCRCSYFVAQDLKQSANTSTDTHDFFWVDFDNVESKLSYPSTREVWAYFRPKILNYFKFNS